MDSTVNHTTVLVVEDNDELRQLMVLALVAHGCKPIEATNGQQAFQIARHRCPDIILMDIGLPVLDGLSATQQIRGLGDACQVPIVAVSAYNTPEQRKAALDAGCDAFISKPVDPNQLNDVLGLFLPHKTA